MCNGWNITIVPSGPAQVQDSGMMASLKNIPSNGSVTDFRKIDTTPWGKDLHTLKW